MVQAMAWDMPENSTRDKILATTNRELNRLWAECQSCKLDMKTLAKVEEVECHSKNALRKLGKRIVEGISDDMMLPQTEGGFVFLPKLLTVWFERTGSKNGMDVWRGTLSHTLSIDDKVWQQHIAEVINDRYEIYTLSYFFQGEAARWKRIKSHFR